MWTSQGDGIPVKFCFKGYRQKEFRHWSSFLQMTYVRWQKTNDKWSRKRGSSDPGANLFQNVMNFELFYLPFKRHSSILLLLNYLYFFNRMLTSSSDLLTSLSFLILLWLIFLGTNLPTPFMDISKVMMINSWH